MLNKQKGNMYGFVTHTFNTVKGKCPHDCSYCYMKRFGKQVDLHFDEVELRTGLGENNFIFIGSSCDMWAEEVRGEWIFDTLSRCRLYFRNKYLFQSKNPQRILDFFIPLPKNSVIATTIETNRSYPEMGKAPLIGDRIRALREIKEQGFQTMITIEPIMNFDIMPLIACIFYAGPDWVNIGADSQGHNLPEPTPKMTKELIERLSGFTEVRQKPNLKRLLKG